MAKMFVEPEKVHELIRRLDNHTRETQQKQKHLNAFIKNMQQSWNDAHYKSFVEQFEEFNKMISKAMHLSESVLIPNLKNVKKYAEDYKNLGKK